MTGRRMTAWKGGRRKTKGRKTSGSRAAASAVGLERAIAAAARELRSTGKALVTCHVSPDGDAIGSGLALALALRARSAEVVFYSEDPVPYNYAFLPGASTVVRKVPAGARFDHTFILDLSDASRLGRGFPREGLGTVVNVDHHATGPGIGGLQVRDEHAAATGELVCRLFKAARVPISPEIATNLYCAILTDTGSFRYSNSTPGAFAAAGRMVACGAEPWRIASEVYESEPAARYHLLGRALSTLHVSCGGRFASLYVTSEMYRATGASKEMTDQFVNFARALKGVEVAAFLRELPDGRFKASLRSRGGIDVSAVGVRFGGGGHRNAAGAELPGPLDHARATIERVVAEVLGCTASSV
ncbi:MAG: bifunctional oligoribonuclease/PAP phosphatase NrnA [Deltaproteobacteria bacterium]|nr:bifunctional oligoribonuclease/PAP phosphatase NrnA [Deltaproteobacteria bacterium]